MKKLLVILLMSYSLFTYSQIRIGHSLNDILSEFDNIESYDSGNVKYLSKDDNKGIFVYIFGIREICFQCNFTPKSENILDSYIDYYNTNYFIISEGIWITDEYPHVVIELRYDKVLNYYFFIYKMLNEYDCKKRESSLHYIH